MKDIDEEIAGWSPNRDFSFKVRGETFAGSLGMDYEVVSGYMGAMVGINAVFPAALNALLLAFLGADEYERFDTWRTDQRLGGNPLTIHEASIIGAKVIEEEAQRPTRASSGSSTGRETNGAGSTVAYTSPVTVTDPPASLLAVS